MKRLAFILLFASAVCGAPTSENEVEDTSLFGSLMGIAKECSDGDITLCLKEKALKYTESLATARELNLADGVSLIGSGSSRAGRSYEPLSEEPEARENQVEARLLDSAADFLENHVIQFRMPKAAVEEVKRSLEEGRGKKKKLKQLLPILAILKLKIAALIPLFLGIIAFAAFKALILGKIALLVSGLIALKKLLAQKHHHEQIEVVAHPHHEEHYSASSGHGWGRAAIEAAGQDLAYSAHAKQE